MSLGTCVRGAMCALRPHANAQVQYQLAARAFFVAARAAGLRGVKPTGYPNLPVYLPNTRQRASHSTATAIVQCHQQKCAICALTYLVPALWLPTTVTVAP